MDFSFIKINKVTVSSAVGIFIVLFVLALVFHSMALGLSSISFAVFAVCIPFADSEHSGSSPAGWIALVAFLAFVFFFVIGLYDAMNALPPTL